MKYIYNYSNTYLLNSSSFHSWFVMPPLILSINYLVGKPPWLILFLNCFGSWLVIWPKNVVSFSFQWNLIVFRHPWSLFHSAWSKPVTVIPSHCDWFGCRHVLPLLPMRPMWNYARVEVGYNRKVFFSLEEVHKKSTCLAYLCTELWENVQPETVAATLPPRGEKLETYTLRRAKQTDKNGPGPQDVIVLLN